MNMFQSKTEGRREVERPRIKLLEDVEMIYDSRKYTEELDKQLRGELTAVMKEEWEVSYRSVETSMKEKYSSGG
jgi:hypothetical protein